MIIALHLYADPRWNDITKFLESVDTDGNGTLSKDEFMKGVVAFCGVSAEEAEAIVAWVNMKIKHDFLISQITCSDSHSRAGVKSTITVLNP